MCRFGCVTLLAVGIVFVAAKLYEREQILFGDNLRKASNDCHQNVDVGVCAVVVREERVLFVRSTYGIGAGCGRYWRYAQHDETLDQAALRELREEAVGRSVVCFCADARDEEGGRF